MYPSHPHAARRSIPRLIAQPLIRPPVAATVVPFLAARNTSHLRFGGVIQFQGAFASTSRQGRRQFKKRSGAILPRIDNDTLHRERHLRLG